MDETVDVGVVLARIAAGMAAAVAGAEPAASRPRRPRGRAPGRPSAPRPPRRPRAAPAAAGRRTGRRRRGTGPRGRRYSPVVQRIAAEHGIDLDAVTGTGRDGRVRKQDVLASSSPAARRRMPPLHIESPYRRSPMARRTRRRGAGGPRCRRGPAVADAPPDRRAHEALAGDRRPLHDLDRGRHGPVEAARGGSGSPRCRSSPGRRSTALREHPSLNAWLEGERYTRHDDVNLGIAVSLGDDGLIVPVDPPRPRALGRGAGGADPRPRPPGARARADSRRGPRRDVHDHQPRPVRLDHGDADHQPAAGGDPRPRGGGQAPGRGHRRATETTRSRSAR